MNDLNIASLTPVGADRVSGGGAANNPPPGSRAAEIREAARAFEAVFLAEMLAHTGANKAPDAFGGGFGEEAFAGMMTETWAKMMVEAGGVGVAERIEAALLSKAGGDA